MKLFANENSMNHFSYLKADDIKDKLFIIIPDGIRVRKMKQ